MSPHFDLLSFTTLLMSL